MRSVRLVLCVSLMVCVLGPRQLHAKDPRHEAVEKLLLTKWDAIPDDIVVEIVLDPVISQAERRQVLQFYLKRQESVGRTRDYIWQNYLPRLERMFTDMPGEDVRSAILALQGMADLIRDRDGTDTKMLEFLDKQMATPDLSRARHAACQILLSNLRGNDIEPVSEKWRNQEREVLALLAKGVAADAYREALSVASDVQRSIPDRISALQYLDGMLTKPTGISFNEMRNHLVAACLQNTDARLATVLVRSIRRAAFLERLEPGDVSDALKSLKNGGSLTAQQAADAALADLQARKEIWQFDLQKHMVEADHLIRQANLDAAARQEYRMLVASADYCSHPVGESPRWWVLGKFLWRHDATAASVAAFKRYLQTRDSASRADGYLKSAVQILGSAHKSSAKDPAENWMDLAMLTRGKAAQAFVTVLAEHLSKPEDNRVLIRFGLQVLQHGAGPDLSEAVLHTITFSSADVSDLRNADSSVQLAPDCRVATAAAYAREGRYGESIEYLDLAREDPLPNVPLFRVVGVADVLLTRGKTGDAERLIRSLLARDLQMEPSINLLVYLLNSLLSAGYTDHAIRVQDELVQRYGATASQSVVAALAKCLSFARDKDAAAEVILTRALCEIMNGDAYPIDRGRALPPEKSLQFWRAVLAWSQDNAKTDELEHYVDLAPESSEAEVAHVLLARSALDKEQDSIAASFLESMPGLAAPSALGQEERRRFKAIKERRNTLVSTVRQAARQLADAAGEAGKGRHGAEAYLLLAEFEGKPDARLHALSDALRICKRERLGADSVARLRDQLARVQSGCDDSSFQAQCDALARQIDQLRMPAESVPDAHALAVLEDPLDLAYVDAMGQVGRAFRTGGQYRRAIEYFHRGFEGAPFAKRAASLLKEEAWTLQFYLGATDEAQVRLRQLVAIYPRHPAGQWARTYLSTLASELHPE